MDNRVLSLLSLLLVTACAPTVGYTGLTPSGPSRGMADRVDVYTDDHNIPSGVTVLGEIKISDTGFSMGCGRDDVIGIAKDKARKVGADAIYVVKLQTPDLISTCHRLTARALKYPAGYAASGAGEPNTPRPSASEREPGLPVVIGSGTGFFVNNDGNLLTNAHVVDKCSAVRIRGDNAALTVVRVDKENDLALLKASLPSQKYAVFRQGRGIRPGDSVVAVGFPLSGILASEANITTGGVSALAGLGDDVRFLQVTAPVQPGNSGGPLLDGDGRVVGVVTSKLNALRIAGLTGDVPQNINFAVNASVARMFMDAVGVSYHAGEGARDLSAADIGEQAKSFTVMLECWQSSTGRT